MAKLIKTLHDRAQFAFKKGVTGFVSPDRLDSEAFAEIMNLWKKYIDEYAATRKISLYLKPFEKIEAVSSLTGTPEGTKVVTSCHKYPISVATTSGNIPVQILTIAEYTDRVLHPNKPPVTAYPICKFVKDTMYVYPAVNVSVTYIATPVKPKYAFTISGDDYIYDDVNSIDIEFDEVLHDEILNRVLANVGINMRDLDLIRFSQQEKISEGR